MVLSDFLSRQDPGDEDTKEIIPISFNMKSILQDKYYNVDENMDKYMVQTRSQVKASGVKLPEVHGSKKGLDPHRVPERQTQSIARLEVDRKPRIGPRKSWSEKEGSAHFGIKTENYSIKTNCYY